MRFGSLNATSIQITPIGGAAFTINTVGAGVSPLSALEAIVSELAAQNVYGASIVGTAAAANKAVAELNNPAASGRVLYVYSVDIFVPVSMAVNLFADGTSLVPAGTGVNLSFGGAGGGGRVGGSNQLATTGSLFYTTPALTVNATYFVPLQYLVRLPAGHNLQLQGQTVNQAFTCNVRWWESTA